MRQYQSRQTTLLGLGKARHIGLGKDVRGMLVITGMRDRDADLVQQRCKAQGQHIRLAGLGIEFAKQRLRQSCHTLSL